MMAFIKEPVIVFGAKDKGPLTTNDYTTPLPLIYNPFQKGAELLIQWSKITLVISLNLLDRVL